MPQFFKKQAEEVQDLKEILTDFWLGIIRGEQKVESGEQLKASELLAKYILGDGKTSVRGRRGHRPATSEVLKLADQLEIGDQ